MLRGLKLKYDYTIFDDYGSGLGGELCVLSLFCDKILGIIKNN